MIGRGRVLPYTGAVFAVAGLALAGLPPFGTALGKALMERGAEREGVGWLVAVFMLASVVTGGVVLRAGARIFLGLGREEPGETPAEVEADERAETSGPRRRTPPVMALPAVALVAGALALGVIPRIGERSESAAHRFQDREAYAGAVLAGTAEPSPPDPEAFHWEPGALAMGIGGAVGAVLLAVGALHRELLPRPIRRGASASVGRGLRALKVAHSGHVGDYTAWLTLGTAAVGGAVALVLR
jgi:multicomponent Na+:H+ antiporter subunit D